MLTNSETLLFPVGIYLFKVNNRNTRKQCKVCSKLTKKPITEQCQLAYS